MKRAMRNPKTDEVFFKDVEEDKLYYRNAKRAVIELPVAGIDVKRALFIHRGHPNPRIPQLDYWTVSDIETGHAISSEGTVQKAIDEATEALAQDNAIVKLVKSIVSFIDEYGRANLVPNKPVIREGSMLFWYEKPLLRWARVKSQRRHLNPDNGIACLITHHPTSVVAMPDIVYVWPELKDLYDEAYPISSQALGPQGTFGHPGPPGDQGSQDTIGHPDPPGNQGPQSSIGHPDPPGKQGPTGEQGPAFEDLYDA